MPRTADDVAFCDELAAKAFYQPPPPALEPSGPVGTSTWRELSDWFEVHTQGWHDCLLVYISRRWDTPIAVAYAETDAWMKGEFQRRDLRDDPDAVVSYN
ncbi:MAG: hypothetical protein ABI216_04215 [Devosia sp.]